MSDAGERKPSALRAAAAQSYLDYCRRPIMREQCIRLRVSPISPGRADELVKARLLRQQLGSLRRGRSAPSRGTLQVIPFGAGAHPAMESTFNILDFHEPTPSVVYVEGLVGTFTFTVNQT